MIKEEYEESINIYKLEYIIKLNNEKTYSLLFGYQKNTNNIIIELTEKDYINSEIYYKTEYSITNIKKLFKNFENCENNIEILECIRYIMESYPVEINKNDSGYKINIFAFNYKMEKEKIEIILNKFEMKDSHKLILMIKDINMIKNKTYIINLETHNNLANIITYNKKIQMNLIELEAKLQKDKSLLYDLYDYFKIIDHNKIINN